MKKIINYDFLDKEKNFKNYVLNTFCKTQSMFLYHNLPESVPQNILEKFLQMYGFACFAKYNDELYIFQGGLGGSPDVYNEPTTCTVANPALQLSKDFVIDKDCIIVKNDSFNQGLTPIIEKYCSMLVENNISTLLATINTRITNIFAGGDEITKNSAEEYLRNIIAGKVGVIATNAFIDSLSINPASRAQDNTISNLITQNQYIKSCLLNDIGLSANTLLKKERLLNAEIAQSSDSLYPFIDDMLRCRRKGIEKVNKMFGTSIEVELNSSWDYRLYNGMSIHNTQEEIELEEIENETDNQENSCKNAATDVINVNSRNGEEIERNFDESITDDDETLADDVSADEKDEKDKEDKEKE